MLWNNALYLFVNKSWNLIYLLWIKICSYKNYTVDTIRKICSRSNVSLSNWWREEKLFQLVTGTEHLTKYKQNILPNINTCENGWDDSHTCRNGWLSANLRIRALKLNELIQFPSPNLSICFYFLRAVASRWRHQED